VRSTLNLVFPTILLNLFSHFVNALFFVAFFITNLVHFPLQRSYIIKSRYVWIEQPMVWCGKNHWSFALVINPKNNEVKEVFINFDN